MTVFRIDKNRGSDTNDGITAPWKELTKLDDANRTAGDMILLADDSVWEYDLATRIIPPQGWSGTEENPVIIGKYSPLSGGLSTQRPTIRWNRKIQANEWTYDAPNNGWVCNMPYAVGDKCLVRINNTWLAASNSDLTLPLFTEDGWYHPSAGGTSFHMYAPSHTNPTDYYGEVLLSLTGIGFISISNNRQWVQVENLRFEDTGCGILAFSDSATTTGLIADGIQGKTVSCLVSAVTTGTLGQLHATIRNMDVEDWGSTAIRTFTSSGQGLKKLDIHHNRLVDGMHNFSQGAIYCQSRSPNMRPQIHHNYITHARWGTKFKDLDGCGIYLEIGSGDVDVYSNYVADSYMAVQDNSGRANRWFSNLIVNCKSAMRGGDGTNVGTLDFEFFNNTCIIGANIAPVFGSVSEVGMRIYANNGNPMTGLKIYNNLFYNMGALKPAAIMTPTTTPGVSDYSHNALWGYTTTAKREFAPFTVESSPNTVTADPKLTADFVPTINSPLLGAGKFVSRIRDFDGKQMPNIPPIGAYCPATLRKTHQG